MADTKTRNKAEAKVNENTYSTFKYPKYSRNKLKRLKQIVVNMFL